jgi:hypothetical protein
MIDRERMTDKQSLSVPDVNMSTVTCHVSPTNVQRFNTTYLMSDPNLPDDLSQADSSLSFASRNATKDVIPSCFRPHKKLTDAEKISANTKRELNKENANALKVEVNAFFDHRNAEISRLAKKYNKSEVNVKLLLTNETRYQKTRAPSLQNALVHAKGLEVNEGT